LLLCAFVALVNVLHKTDGSYVNRPFFRCRQDVQETAFPPKDILSRSVFCFFSSRKENVPLSEEKKSFSFIRRKENVPLKEAVPCTGRV
jgi:hypothetical protein